MVNFAKNKLYQMARVFYIVFSTLFFLSCATTGIEKTDNGIIVRVKQENSHTAKTIRLNVIDNNIIHVSAIPGKIFSDEKSLILRPGLKRSGTFSVYENGDEVTLSTDSLHVVIRKSTGEIAFLNKKGECILQEN